MTTPSSSNPMVASVPNGKPCSFIDALAGEGGSSFNLKFVHYSFKGCPALLIDDSVVAQLAKPFALTLVGKFVLKRPNIDVIRKFFYNLKLSSTFHIGLLDPRHVAIQLTNDLDYSKIFSRGSYYIQSCQMCILKWTPDFDVRHESPIVPVWVSFPNLRLHFFNTHILFGWASILGRPLQTDQATASVSRPSVARILVEVDISKKFPNEIWLGSELNGYFQKVEFENFPIFCAYCKMHGHSLNECFKLHLNLKKSKENSKIIKMPEANTVKDSNHIVMEENGVLTISNVVEVQPDFQAVIIPSVIRPNELPVCVVGDGVAKVNNLMAVKTNDFIETLHVIQDGSQALVNSSLQLRATVKDIENDVVEEVEPSHHLADSIQLQIEEHSIEDHESNSKLDKGYRLNSDAYTDTEIDILAKCYAREDNDISFSKSRGIGCPSSKLRVKNLCRIHNIAILILLEPLISMDKLPRTARRVLWEQLLQFNNVCNLPWLVGGDFNTISKPDERLGGSLPIYQSMDEFNDMILACSLMDIGYSGNRFTWHRGHLWQRLDSVLFNNSWVNTFNLTKVEHLSRTLSDHSPLLINIKNNPINIPNQFRFQNMWILHDSFLDVVQVNWNALVFPDDSISGMYRLWLKLKRLLSIIPLRPICAALMKLKGSSLRELSKLQVQEEAFWR
ncbi:uncharacterized protein LOC110108584 [Dendrobium catenatum]|uniref:uncharacterized protein LOC110108584 n=1 Tax=Dendrobium catenatum TaxID=906689 RepID=UPI0010A04A9C|nr:uncharacterized protein LOC110108584 [Dendrobium catenatum]